MPLVDCLNSFPSHARLPAHHCPRRIRRKPACQPITVIVSRCSNPYGDLGFNGLSKEDAPPGSLPYTQFLEAVKAKKVEGVVFQPPNGDVAYAIIDGKSQRIGEGWPVEISNSWSSPSWVVRILENEGVPYAVRARAASDRKQSQTSLRGWSESNLFDRLPATVEFRLEGEEQSAHVGQGLRTLCANQQKGRERRWPGGVCAAAEDVWRSRRRDRRQRHERLFRQPKVRDRKTVGRRYPEHVPPVPARLALPA